MIIGEQPNLSFRPDGWPWNRPIQWPEVLQLIRQLVIRRVPRTQPIEESYLISLVVEDMVVVSGKLWIYIRSRKTWGWRCSKSLATKLATTSIRELVKTNRLRRGMMVTEEPTISPKWGIYQTDLTADLAELVPKKIQALLDYLPARNLAQLLAVVETEEE